MEPGRIAVRCCIAGGGPAGMMLGFLLARAGVEVLVLEKHADFLRDFRGDTIHPSTLEVMHELGLLEEFLRRPHQEVQRLAVKVGDVRLEVADFTHLPTRCRFIATMPQWDFLDFLAERGRALPGFGLRMRSEVTDIIEANGRVVGLRAVTPEGPLEVRADLIVAADGRTSIVRGKAGLAVEELGAPMDVLWFRLPREPSHSEETMGIFGSGHIFIMIQRGDYWQCGYVIPKGSLEELRAAGLPAFRGGITALAPFIRDVVGELRDWDQVKLLTVRVDRLREWSRPGLLCIGDAAHAMSPVGGVGINLAIQDAVAAANLLSPILREGAPNADQLRQVQRRRDFPVRMTQRMQVLVQNRVVVRALKGRERARPALVLRLFDRFPVLRRLPARIIGLGVRPEHVRLPAGSLH